MFDDSDDYEWLEFAHYLNAHKQFYYFLSLFN